MNKKSILFKIGALVAVLSLNASVFISSNNKTQKVEAYDSSSLPTTIDLNDCGEQEIRTYYSSLNSLSESERKGTNLLKNLKPILSNNQKYYNYDSGNTIWQMYEITDRDWVRSPANAITYGSYNANTNIISNYQYGTSNSNGKNNPYLHALYIDRDIANHQVKAWGNHEQDEWGINREHIWAKSHGFQANGAGGARGDPMHLWAANGYANNIHSNYFFAFVDKTRSYEDCGDKYSSVPNNLRGYSKNAGGNEKVFEPQDSDKGDIARAVFYMVARYNNYANAVSGFDTNNPNLVLVNDLSENSVTGTSSANTPYGMGLLRDLLAWNKLDPVDEYEIHRNNLLYKNFTNNRNPFIDFPSWADSIWGTANLDGTNYNSTITTSVSPSTDPINAIESNTFGISTHSLNLEVNDTAEIYATNADGNISWSINDNTVASLNKTSTSNNEIVTITALKAGTATITATSGGNSVSCVVIVGNVINYGTLENPLSVDEAINLISSLPQNGVTEEPLYVKGIVTSNSSYNTTYYNYDYAWLQNNDGSDDQAFELFRFKLDSGVIGSYSAANSMVNKEVVAYGYGQVHNGTPELTTSNSTPKNPIVYEINDPEPTGIILNQDTVNVEVGDTATLVASLIPNNAVSTIVWESSDESVATVDNGVITGVSNGQAVITARASEYDLEAECVVTVTGGVITPSDYLNNATSYAKLFAKESKASSPITTTKTVNELVEDNDWVVSSGNDVGDLCTDFDLDDNINVSTTGGPNCGSIWGTSTHDYRLYQNKSGNIIFTANNGCVITSIKLTYNTSSNGILKYGDTTLTSNTAVAINSLTSVTFNVANSGNGTSGQVRITEFSVTYNVSVTAADQASMTFGGSISKEDWDAINDLDGYQINDYGVMVFRTTEEQLSNVLTVEEYFKLGPENVAIVRKGSGTPSAPENGYYDFFARINFGSTTNYFNIIYCAAPFILINDQYYFLPEQRYSVNSLATYYKTHDGCDLSSDALQYLSITH